MVLISSTVMSQFRRDYLELKQAEAMDFGDQRSFPVPRATNVLNRPDQRLRKSFCTLHSNRNCNECRKKKSLAQKRRRQRTLGVDLLVNDFHGFHWIDSKVNEHQTLNIAGKSMRGAHDIVDTIGVIQNNRLFFPQLAIDRPILVIEKAGIYRKIPGVKNRKLEGFESKKRPPPPRVSNVRKKDIFQQEEVSEHLPALQANHGVNLASSRELKELKSTKEKRRINVVLPRIS